MSQLLFLSTPPQDSKANSTVLQEIRLQSLGGAKPLAHIHDLQVSPDSSSTT